MKESLELLSRAIHEWMPKNRPVSQVPAAAELEKILDISLGEEGCDQAHYSAQKAANVLAIGTDNLVTVASKNEGRICSVALQKEITKSLKQGHLPFYIGLTAGTTVIGAYDPVAVCSKIARAHNIWLHIDAAGSV